MGKKISRYQSFNEFRIIRSIEKPFPSVVPVVRLIGPAGARPRWTGPRGPVTNKAVKDPQ